MSKLDFHILTKPIGPICNLDCKYCFYLEKEVLYPDVSKWAMREDVLESYIRQYIEAQAGSEVHFAWQGGEPTLLGVEYFRRAVELQKKFANGKTITNAFQTNGVLLNDEWADLFHENSFLVGVSIDGPRELHDTYRVDKGGRPTFDRVLRGIEVLKRRHVDFNTLTTVHRGNAGKPLEVYRFLKECGSGYMQFIPVVERIASHSTRDGLVLVSAGFADRAMVAPWSVDARQFGTFLCTIFDEWVRKDVGRYFVQLFDISLQMWLGMEPSLCIFRKRCGAALAIEHCGDVYSCDHFVYPENRLGNIMETPLESLVLSEEQRRFGEAKETSLPKYCRDCDVRFACNGECPKHRFTNTPDGEPGLNYLCAGYKMFFHHVDRPMRFMAAELAASRPPANVMGWMMAEDASRQMGKIGRNDPCVCGSDRKFKHCCGRPR
jgi:uncharacterized protein